MSLKLICYNEKSIKKTNLFRISKEKIILIHNAR